MTQATMAVTTRSRTLRVPHSPASVPETRRAVVADLRARDLPAQVVDEAEIAVSELLGNAMRHASPLPDGAVRVHWMVRGGVVELDVTDGGSPTQPKPVHAGTYATSGRGPADRALARSRVGRARRGPWPHRVGEPRWPVAPPAHLTS